ncbi:MAG: hypothetical protein ABEJ56_03370 [Candidatus Nanohaloarchaea archaeon]
MELLSEKVKKLNPRSNGIGVYVTAEAKKFGGETGDHVKVSAVRDEEGKEDSNRKTGFLIKP